MPLHCIILAAGKGTRMRSARPKVLQTLAGRPLLAYVIDQATALGAAQIHVVVGHGAEDVKAHFSDRPELNWVLQTEQLGTGHAVAQALPDLPDAARVLVLYGDVPLVNIEELKALVTAGREDLAILSARLDDPSGYGRILRDDAGAVQAIVEEKDANAAQRAVQEVNTGLLAAPAARLRGWCEAMSNNNAQGEYYLTDCVSLSVSQGLAVQGVMGQDPLSVAGVNDRIQLASLERVVQGRQAETLMAAGLQLLDPARFDLRGELIHGQDCRIDVNCVFAGRVVLGDDVQIGAHCHLVDVEVGSGCRIEPHSVLQGASLGAACQVGPFARLRPGTELADGAKVGNFVETKKTYVGPGSKINHLSYVGDATLGRGVNVGAGTITCNYDGANKHLTEIEDGAFIGSNSALVAPVKVGRGATLGAGTVLTRDAPDEQLTVARGKQRSIAGWQRPTKKKD